jgi:hypothetical protein
MTNITDLHYHSFTNAQKRSIAFLKSEDFGLISHEYDLKTSKATFDFFDMDDVEGTISINILIESGSVLNDYFEVVIHKGGKIDCSIYPYHVMYDDNPNQYYGMNFAK